MQPQIHLLRKGGATFKDIKWNSSLTYWEISQLPPNQYQGQVISTGGISDIGDDCDSVDAGDDNDHDDDDNDDDDDNGDNDDDDSQSNV